MDRIINLKLLSHPLNWLIVWLVLIFSGVAWALVHEHFTSAPTPANEQEG